MPRKTRKQIVEEREGGTGFPAKYDDGQAGWIRNFITELTDEDPMKQLLQQPEKWRKPKGVKMKYSTVKPEHLSHKRKRNRRRKGAS